MEHTKSKLHDRFDHEPERAQQRRYHSIFLGYRFVPFLSPYKSVRRNVLSLLIFTTIASITLLSIRNTSESTGPWAAMPKSKLNTTPAPPELEAITVRELPLPPTSPTDAVGACTTDINPHGTGCVSQNLTISMQSGNFMPDGLHIVAFITFAGAPGSPDPASIYSGPQIILVKTEANTNFPNGDSWKCITCGIPAENAVGRSPTNDYPHAFSDGKRLLVGSNIVECSADLVDEACVPQNTYVYPIRLESEVDGSGPGAHIRELRLHPDNVHLGFSAFVVTDGAVNQYGYMSRLSFNAKPSNGEPLSPRYDLINTQLLVPAHDNGPIYVNPNDKTELLINRSSITIGELRGFSGTGNEITYIGYPAESSNFDVFAVHITTGAVRRLTSHPEYVDPVDISPDDEWTVVMDTRGSDRQMWLSGLRGVPPVTDIVSSSAVASTRNNGLRRFFQPWIIDRYGDRGEYYGQQVNAEGSSVYGSGAINDPSWNGMADPSWSPDGTRIVYWQSMTVSPACGGLNPLPCYNSTAEGGRTGRLMLAHLTSRTPKSHRHVDPVPDEIPWATSYIPGHAPAVRELPPAGDYKLWGRSSVYANVTLTMDTDGTTIHTVRAVYHRFCDDGLNILEGYEKVSKSNPTPTLNRVHWFSDLVQVGPLNGTKKTSADGFHLDIDLMVNDFNANGTLSTIIDGKQYFQPANGT